MGNKHPIFPAAAFCLLCVPVLTGRRDAVSESWGNVWAPGPTCWAALTKHYKLSLRTTEICCPHSLRTQNLKSGCLQTWFFLRARRKKSAPGHVPSFWRPIGNLCVPWLLKTSAQSLSPCTHSDLSVHLCVQILPFYKDTLTFNQGRSSWYHVNEFHLWWSYFQIRTRAEIQRLGLERKNFRKDTIQSLILPKLN